MRDETKCLHAGYTPKNTEPCVIPIVQSTTYVYDSTEEVASVFDNPMKSLIYSRFGNPTVMAVERKIAELEGGIGALCTTCVDTQKVTIHYNCIGAFDVPEWDSIPDIDILLETRKGVAVSYSQSQAVVNF